MCAGQRGMLLHFRCLVKPQRCPYIKSSGGDRWDPNISLFDLKTQYTTETVMKYVCTPTWQQKRERYVHVNNE